MIQYRLARDKPRARKKRLPWYGVVSITCEGSNVWSASTVQYEWWSTEDIFVMAEGGGEGGSLLNTEQAALLEEMISDKLSTISNR